MRLALLSFLALPLAVGCGDDDKAEHAQQQATEHAFTDPQDMARQILRTLPEVLAVLPPDEAHAVLNDLPRFM